MLCHVTCTDLCCNRLDTKSVDATKSPVISGAKSKNSEKQGCWNGFDLESVYATGTRAVKGQKWKIPRKKFAVTHWAPNQFTQPYDLLFQG